MKYELNARLNIRIKVSVEVGNDIENPNQKAYQLADDHLYNTIQELQNIPGIIIDKTPEHLKFVKVIIEGEGLDQ